MERDVLSSAVGLASRTPNTPAIVRIANVLHTSFQSPAANDTFEIGKGNTKIFDDVDVVPYEGTYAEFVKPSRDECSVCFAPPSVHNRRLPGEPFRLRWAVFGRGCFNLPNLFVRWMNTHSS